MESTEMCRMLYKLLDLVELWLAHILQGRLELLYVNVLYYYFHASYILPVSEQ
jgi:hypothetical protein